MIICDFWLTDKHDNVLGKKVKTTRCTQICVGDDTRPLHSKLQVVEAVSWLSFSHFYISLSQLAMVAILIWVVDVHKIITLSTGSRDNSLLLQKIFSAFGCQ